MPDATEVSMNRFVIGLVSAAAVGGFLQAGNAATLATPAAMATPDATIATGMTAVPANTLTVTDWYKQSVYDRADNKIGEVKDVLVDKDGKIAALIIGVGGFLGAGEKDVSVPFSAVAMTTKDNNKFYLVMDATKDGLKSAPGYTYDSTTTTWVPTTHS
jgi:sporulation protein YlmC with PRC-barrel domain